MSRQDRAGPSGDGHPSSTAFVPSAPLAEESLLSERPSSRRVDPFRRRNLRFGALKHGLPCHQLHRPCSWSTPTHGPKAVTRGWPLAGPAVTRACSLRIEGSRLAPHQEGWALEALKYAGSYVPPTSLALFSLRHTEVQLRKVSPNDPCRRALPKKRALPVKRGPLQAREALRPSAPFRTRFGCQPDSLVRLHVPRDTWRSSQPCAFPRRGRRLAYRLVRRRHVHETGDELHHRSESEDSQPKEACLPS